MTVRGNTWLENLGLDRWALISMILGVLGIVDASYLTWVKLSGTSPYCIGNTNCEAVLTSAWATVFGIPLSVYGLAAYLTLVAVLVLETRIAVVAEWGATIVFLLTLAGLLVSGYLVYLQVVVIGEICPYCMVSAGTMTLLFVISLVRVQQLFRAVDLE